MLFITFIKLFSPFITPLLGSCRIIGKSIRIMNSIVYQIRHQMISIKSLRIIICLRKFKSTAYFAVCKIPDNFVIFYDVTLKRLCLFSAERTNLRHKHFPLSLTRDNRSRPSLILMFLIQLSCMESYDILC